MWIGTREEPYGTSHQTDIIPDVDVRHYRNGVSMGLYGLGTPLDWVFAPYAHQPSAARLQAFEAELRKKFYPDYLEPKRLKELVRDNASREALRAAYDLTWSDHNLVSMALYAGPSTSFGWSGSCISGHSVGFGPFEPEGPAGWMSTGDMHLGVRARRDAFSRHYGQLLRQVNVFVVPHHGSARNFHASILGEVPDATQFVAAAGPNGYGHPNRGLIGCIRSARRDFVQVSEDLASTLQWHLWR